MAFELPPLPYDTSALAGAGMCEETLELHHGKHHQAYVTALNGFVEKDPSLQGKSLDEIVQATAQTPGPIFNNAGQHWNHIIFWQNLSPKGGQIQGMNHEEKGDKLPVDAELSSVSPDQFDALVLPGGVANPDTLRTMPQAVAFVKHFVQAGKPIAAICHGPWTLIEADGVRGRRVTSWPSLKTDLTNAGAHWVDQTVVQDGPLITSRKPDDIPAFSKAFIGMLEEGAQPSGAPLRAAS